MANGSMVDGPALADSATFGDNFQQFGPDPMGAILEVTWSMESRIISERSFQFAVRTVKLCERIWKRGWTARRLAEQLFDAGTSIGANVAESQGGQTKPDFLAKMAIARKESWETLYWLKLAIATSIITNDEVAWELDEASS